MMSSRSSVLIQSVTTAVPGPQHVVPRTYLTTLSSSTAPKQATQGSESEDEPQPNHDSDGSVYCDAVQSQHSSDSVAEAQPPHPSSAALATPPVTTVPGNVWNYSEPVPGSKRKKLIFYRAPFEWGQWTREQWQERFIFVKDKLEALVYKHLRLVDFTNRPVFSPRMVGTSPSEARPAVVVTCRDADFKNIRNLFHARAEEPLCLGRVPAVSQLRASFGRRAERTVSTIPRLQLVYYRTSTPPVTRHALRKPLAVSLGAGGAACGGIIRYGEQSATLGVALDVRGQPRILTVDHLFSSRETNPQSSAFDRDSSCPNLPSFLALADLDRTDSNSLWEDDDEYEDLAWPDDEFLGPHQLDSEMTDATQVYRTEDLEREPAQWEWKLWSNSSDPASPAAAYLDWALTYPESTTPEASGIYLNTVFPTGNENEGIVLSEIQSAPVYHLAPVYLVSGIRGFLSGQIIHAPSFLPANTAGKGSCEVWTVILNEPSGVVLSGESGSVVVDSATNNVYGHVVGSDPLGHAYVVPLAQLLEQLRDCFDLNAGLATATRLWASSENRAGQFTSRTAPDSVAAMSEESVSKVVEQSHRRVPGSQKRKERDDWRHLEREEDETLNHYRRAVLDSHGGPAFSAAHDSTGRWITNQITGRSGLDPWVRSAAQVDSINALANQRKPDERNQVDDWLERRFISTTRIISPWSLGGLGLSVKKPLNRLWSKSDTSNIVDLWKRAGGPPVSNLVNTKVNVPETDDDEDEEDDLDEDPEIKAESNTLLNDITPNFTGFQQYILKLNPLLATTNSYLVDRIAYQQVIRYKGLLNLRIKHLQAIATKNCPCGTICISQGGSTNVLDSRGDSSDRDITPLEGAINHDSFPQDIPIPPTGSLPAEFECQLCFTAKEFQKPSDWTKHVYEDVQPFTCTWDRCEEPKMFKRKADWVRHENEGHRHLEWWTCDVEDCRYKCYRRDNFLQHLVLEHKFVVPKPKTKVAIKRAGVMDPTWAKVEQCHQETPVLPQQEPCRFCGKCLPSWTKLTVHLAKHMEHISLPVLKLVAKKDLDEDTIISSVQEPPPRS